MSGLGGRIDDDAIVASVVSLARAVGATCIAEGVEPPAQHAALRALDCDFAQGQAAARVRASSAAVVEEPGPGPR
ncbi:MAG: hypothetical protein JWM62_2387 [Frankiales bacterium]|nr:hypothetical protein [Frankiales bacterium]